MPVTRNYWDMRPELYEQFAGTLYGVNVFNNQENMPRTTRNRHEPTVMCKFIDQKGFSNFQRMPLREATDRIQQTYYLFRNGHNEEVRIEFIFEQETRNGVRVYRENVYFPTEQRGVDPSNGDSHIINGSSDGRYAAVYNPSIATFNGQSYAYVRASDGTVGGITPSDSSSGRSSVSQLDTSLITPAGGGGGPGYQRYTLRAVGEPVGSDQINMDRETEELAVDPIMQMISEEAEIEEAPTPRRSRSVPIFTDEAF